MPKGVYERKKRDKTKEPKPYDAVVPPELGKALDAGLAAKKNVTTSELSAEIKGLILDFIVMLKEKKNDISPEYYHRQVNALATAWQIMCREEENSEREKQRMIDAAPTKCIIPGLFGAPNAD